MEIGLVMTQDLRELEEVKEQLKVAIFNVLFIHKDEKYHDACMKFAELATENVLDLLSDYAAIKE